MASTLASAPGKAILFGEHAVVYGEPAIAVPLSSIRTTVEITASQSPTPLQVIAKDIGAVYTIHSTSDPQLDKPGPLAMVKLVLQTLQMTVVPSLTLTIHSDIPVASGLGSGASVSTAIARAMYKHFGIPLFQEQLNQLVYQVEQIYHGTPSGIDNTVIVYEQPIWFIRGQLIEKFMLPHPFYLLIGNTGIPAPTYEAVEDVRTLYKNEPGRTRPIIEQIGHVTYEAKLAILNNHIQELGKLMNKNHELLQTLTVSCEQLDQLVNAAKEAGAYGSKMSGGGRGGNMIALVQEDDIVRVSHALYANGAVDVIKVIIQ